MRNYMLPSLSCSNLDMTALEELNQLIKSFNEANSAKQKYEVLLHLSFLSEVYGLDELTKDHDITFLIDAWGREVFARLPLTQMHSMTLIEAHKNSLKKSSEGLFSTKKWLKNAADKLDEFLSTFSILKDLPDMESRYTNYLAFINKIPEYQSFIANVIKQNKFKSVEDMDRIKAVYRELSDVRQALMKHYVHPIVAENYQNSSMFFEDEKAVKLMKFIHSLGDRHALAVRDEVDFSKDQYDEFNKKGVCVENIRSPLAVHRVFKVSAQEDKENPVLLKFIPKNQTTLEEDEQSFKNKIEVQRVLGIKASLVLGKNVWLIATKYGWFLMSEWMPNKSLQHYIDNNIEKGVYDIANSKAGVKTSEAEDNILLKLQTEIITRYLPSLFVLIEILEDHNIVFSDIKPANLMLNKEFQIRVPDDKTMRVVSNLLKAAYLPNSMTPAFTPPEWVGLTKNDTRDARAMHLYAIGVTLYALLTSKTPTTLDYSDMSQADLALRVFEIGKGPDLKTFIEKAAIPAHRNCQEARFKLKSLCGIATRVPPLDLGILRRSSSESVVGHEFRRKSSTRRRASDTPESDEHLRSSASPSASRSHTPSPGGTPRSGHTHTPSTPRSAHTPRTPRTPRSAHTPSPHSGSRRHSSSHTSPRSPMMESPKTSPMTFARQLSDKNTASPFGLERSKSSRKLLK